MKVKRRKINKNLLICPYCLAHGEKQILCEVSGSTTSVSVERHHRSHTIISGTSFQIVCGRCLNPILVREGTAVFDYSLNMVGSVAQSFGSIL